MGTTEESRMKELIEDLQKQVTALKVLLEVERGFHKQQWVDLTDEDEEQTFDEAQGSVTWAIKLTIAKLREKNGYGS
jgi:hypothetical protein